MATNKELEARIEVLTELLAQHGLTPQPQVATKVTERGDYVEHGSPAHALALGLVKVNGDSKKRCTFTSPTTGTTYALEDEVTPFLQYPEPVVVAGLVLEQKVNELELAPVVPADAQPMWRPRDQPS